LREQATQRLLKSPSFGTFLGEARKVHIYALEILHSKIFPQPLWNVENLSVENRDEKNTSTASVDKLFFSTFTLWIKKRCGSNTKGTFPHKFVLRLLRLKNL